MICLGCGNDFVGRKRRKYCTHICALKHGLRLGYIGPGKDPNMHPKLHDIYWVAGIYEGEGSTCKNSKSITVSVAQKDNWLLEKCKQLFGGVIYHPTDTNNHKRVSEWVIHGSRARGFALTIYSLLSPRRQQQIKRAMEV